MGNIGQYQELFGLLDTFEQFGHFWAIWGYSGRPCIFITSLPSTCFFLSPPYIFIMHCIRLIGNHYVTNWTMATDLRLRIQISLLDHSLSGDLALPGSAESDQKLGGLKKTRKGLLESHASPALVIGARPKIVLSRERHILRPQYILNSCKSFYIAAAIVLNSYFILAPNILPI